MLRKIFWQISYEGPVFILTRLAYPRKKYTMIPSGIRIDRRRRHPHPRRGMLCRQEDWPPAVTWCFARLRIDRDNLAWSEGTSAKERTLLYVVHAISFQIVIPIRMTYPTHKNVAKTIPICIPK